MYLLTLSEIPIYLDSNPSYLGSTKRVAYLNHSASLPRLDLQHAIALHLGPGSHRRPRIAYSNPTPTYLKWRSADLARTHLLYAATGTRSLVFFYSNKPTLKENQVFQLEGVRPVPQQRGCLPTLLVSWLPLWTGPVGQRFWLYRPDEAEIYECPRGRQRLMQRKRK